MQPRIVINQVVSWQGSDCQPKSMPSLFSRFLDSEDEPVTRMLRAGPKWAKLDFAWATLCSCLVITNEGGNKGNAQPTASSPTTAAVLKIMFGDLVPDNSTEAHCLVFPQESMRVTPTPGQNIWVCIDRDVDCKYSIAVFPR